MDTILLLIFDKSADISTGFHRQQRHLSNLDDCLDLRQVLLPGKDAQPLERTIGGPSLPQRYRGKSQTASTDERFEGLE